MVSWVRNRFWIIVQIKSLDFYTYSKRLWNYNLEIFEIRKILSQNVGDSKIDTRYWLMKHNINRQLEKNRFSDLATALINFRMNIWSRCRCMNENVWKNNFEILNTTSEWVMPHWTFYFVIKIVQRPSFWKLDT